ncbi:MAG: cytochrome c [Chloroflexi bacterium]|nr:cytochrome c [Chloroflexota bacterium]
MYRYSVLAALALGLLLALSCLPRAAPGPSPEADSVTSGEAAAQRHGCFACHSVDGSISWGPTWKGLYGKEVSLGDGSQVRADDAYLRESIREPNAQLVAGYHPASMMPRLPVSDQELEALIAYIKTLR